MIRPSPCCVALLVLLLLPAEARAAASSTPDTPTAEADPTDLAPAAEAQSQQPADDPITVRLRAEIVRYYAGISVEPTAQQMTTGLDTARFMLLDGVSLQRITAAVSKAISLHNPGRSVPFEVAVPLRVLPSQNAAAPSISPAPRGELDADESADLNDEEYDSYSASSLLDVASSDERRAQRKEKQEARRNRIRLHRQWQSRNMPKRILLTVGVPSLVIPYSLGFFIAGIMAMDNVVPRSWAFITTVPVIGTLLLGIWTDGVYPMFAMLTVSQGVGLAAVIVGLALNSGKPHEKDPTALHIGKRRDGSAAVTLRAAPLGLGGLLHGRF